jgi:signal transduction histidine kinase
MNVDNLVRVNAQVRSALLAMRASVILLLLIGLGLSSVFVILTARGIIRPLKLLTSSVRQIERGDLDLLVETNSDDEIGELALAFNQMAARLREFRRLDHQRLARTQQTTQAAIDSLPDAVAVLDVQGTIEISNRTAQVHFKLAPGSRIQDIRPDWASAFFEPVLKSHTPFVPDGYRSAIQLFDDSGERFLLPRAVPMVDGQNSLIGVTLVLVEITHLRKADEFKSGLLSAVSHELKTPLTSVRMAMSMLTDPRIGPLNDHQQTLLDAAKRDAERLVRTVSDILTIGRVEAGRARLELVDMSPADLIQRAIATVESAAAERSIQFTTHIPADAPLLHVDANLIVCALTNLLSNAVKFSAPNSTVLMEAAHTPESFDFAVQDEGPGIPDEFRTRIFEKFFRIPTPGGPTGAGLGLSIAADIVQLHDGTITVGPSPLKGSRFVISLPSACVDGAKTGFISRR